MSINNMLVALEEAENGSEFFTVVARHLTQQNGFRVWGIPAHQGFSPGLFAIDLTVPSIDAVYAHAGGYRRFTSVEEVCEFLCNFISREELTEMLKELGYERVYRP